MKRSKLGLFLLIGFTIVIAACQTRPDTSWFTSSPCEAPCWFNIVPGETSSDQILPLLQLIPDIDHESIGRVGEELGSFDDVFFFDWNDSIDGDIYILDNRVSEIVFIPKVKGYAPRYSLGLTVGEIVDQYGEPDYVLRIRQIGPGPLPISDAMHPFVFLINADRGIVMGYDAYYLQEESRDLVTADIEISYLEYFYPGDFERLLEAGAFSSSDTTVTLQPWRGYGEYPPTNP